jgi:hypothetical protein
MTARRRGFDGAPFWGCSKFPDCRGTREVAGGSPELGLAAVSGVQSTPARARGIHFDRIVLACGAVGFAIGLGFIVVAQTSGRMDYALVGAMCLFLMALPVLMSPWLPLGFARSSAFKLACFIVFSALFLVFLVPVATLVSQYMTDAIMHSVRTHSPAIPSTH